MQRRDPRRPHREKLPDLVRPHGQRHGDTQGDPWTTTASTVCVAAGTVTLVASPLSSAFEIGPTTWHGTSGDTGSGDPGTLAMLDAGVKRDELHDRRRVDRKHVRLGLLPVRERHGLHRSR